MLDENDNYYYLLQIYLLTCFHIYIYRYILHDGAYRDKAERKFDRETK